MRAKLRLLIASSVVLMATGGSVLWLFHRPARDEVVRFVPSRAVAYVHVYLRPSTQQQLAIRDLLERLPVDVDDAEELKEALGRLLDPALKVSGMTYSRDVSVWLGDQMGFFVLPGSGGQAVLLSVEEGKLDQAIDAAEKVLSARTQIAAEAVDDVLIMGNQGAVSAALDAVGNETLATDAGYLQAVDPLPRDHTLTVFASTGGSDLALAVSARPNGANFDISIPGGSVTDITVGDLSALLGRLDEANILPFSRFEGMLRTLDEAGPGVLAALQFIGVISVGSEGSDELLGDGYDSSLVFDGQRIERLAGFQPLPESLPEGSLDFARYISHIVLGTRADETIRIFIGVK